MPTLYSANGTKIKCHLGHCEHKTESMGENTHDEGVCWKITQDEFADEQTEAKYCPCKKESGFIRRYDRLGYMERGEHDQMIPRKCEGCGETFLFTIHEHYCIACKILAVTAPQLDPNEVTIIPISKGHHDLSFPLK